jgi:hypothetical protein
MVSAQDEVCELVTSEYDTAGQRFLGTGVRALMEAQGGIYSLVSKESMEHLPDYSIPFPDEDDDVLRGRPIEATSLVVINYDDVINGNFDSVLSSMDRMAVEMANQISAVILAHISDICNKTGNVVTGKLSWDTIADAIEHMDFSFDESGNHRISVVVTEEGAKMLRSIGNPTADQRARLDAIIDRRRDEWNARRGNRSLPSRRV